MKEIPLSRDRVALVDDSDFDWICQWKWHMSTSGYAQRTIYTKGKTKKVYMHRELLKPENGVSVDHANRNRLDNRRENLRLCTMSQNIANAKLWSHNTSGLKGVTFDKRSGKWIGQITINQKYKRLGRFQTKEEAHAAYCEAAKKAFGEFARFE